jgi:hypothetical protein
MSLHGAANLAVLRARFPALASTLAAIAPEPGFEVVAAASGEPTARWRGRLLHSSREPRREAAGLLSRDGAGRSPTAGILFGFGLGYTAEAFAALHPGMPLLVIEPSPSLFLAALEARDLAPLLALPALCLQVGGEAAEVADRLEELPLERPLVLRLRAEIECAPEAFRAFEGVAQSALLRREINVNTLARFGRLWVRNLAANLGHFARAPGVRLLADRLAGIPAVVVAGGPTLEEALPWLPELRRRAVIITVNTPLAACLRAGAAPDAVVVVDPQYWASRHLDWTSCPAAWIVAEPSTHPRSLRRCGGRLLFTGSLFPLGERIEAVVGAKGRLGAGGSVSTTAWDLALLLGCSPLYAAGLDLGFPHMRTHARPATFEELRRHCAMRLLPLETSAFGSLHEIGLFPAPSAAGAAVMTDRRMVLYRAWFEHRLAGSGTPAFLLSGGGIAIAGAAVAHPRDLLDLPCRREEIDARRREVERTLDATEAAGAVRKVTATLEELLEELARLRGLAADGEAGAARLQRALGEGSDPRPSLAALEQVDGRILSLASRSIAGFLVQDLIHAIGGGGLDRSRAAETSGALYRGLRDSAAFHEAVLRRGLSRLQSAQPSRADGRC